MATGVDADTRAQRIERLLDLYGDGSDGSAPTRAQWRALAMRDPDSPVTLINFFKFNVSGEQADQTPISGKEAFDRYAAVSMPTLAKVGGTFLTAGPFAGGFIGADEDWDLVVVGSYPSTESVFALFEDRTYSEAYCHRVASCAHQKVLLLDG